MQWQNIDIAAIARPTAFANRDQTVRYEPRIPNFVTAPMKIVGVTAIADGATVVSIEGPASICALSQ